MMVFNGVLLCFTGYGSHAIYIDDCNSGQTVFGNLLVNISGYGIQHGIIFRFKHGF